MRNAGRIVRFARQFLPCPLPIKPIVSSRGNRIHYADYKRPSGFIGGFIVRLLLAVVLFAFAALSPLSSAQSPPESVSPIRTSSGTVEGKLLPSGIKAWLGIPFAKPPTQELRWKPPQAYSWQGVWHADRKMPECIQVLRPHNINHYFGEEATSEDCLYMNIWAPAKATAESHLPVIVFIYGGGLTIGSSSTPLYSGEPLAQHGVVFVNFNYRVGVLGFMAHPELTREQGGHSGDYGYLDQNAALKWIHDNIARFGGDPARVTIAGQSAGAGSATAQIFSPLSKGLFQRAFFSSGCNWSADWATLAAGEETGMKIQQLLSAADLNAMRQVPADRILALQSENQVMASRQGVKAVPVIDGYFALGSPRTLLQRRMFNDVPLIASSNHEDIDYESNPLTHVKTAAEYEAIARKAYGANAGDFLKLFPVKSDADIQKVAGRAAREAGMQGAARGCAQMQAMYGDGEAHTYLSLFDHKHPYIHGVQIADQDVSTVGSYHTSDLPYWFGTLDALNSVRRTREWSTADRLLSNQMMDLLVTFAATGRPSTAALQWPAWSSSHEQRVVFSVPVTVEPLDAQRMNWLAAHPAAHFAPPPPARARD